MISNCLDWADSIPPEAGGNDRHFCCRFKPVYPDVVQRGAIIGTLNSVKFKIMYSTFISKPSLGTRMNRHEDGCCNQDEAGHHTCNVGKPVFEVSHFRWQHPYKDDVEKGSRRQSLHNRLHRDANFAANRETQHLKYQKDSIVIT